MQGAPNKSKTLPCFVNISTTNRNFTRNFTRLLIFSFIPTYNCQVMLNYRNIWLRYAIWIEATTRFVACKFYACNTDCSIFIKTTKTACKLKRNEVTVASINLADELVISLIFVNNEHFVNIVTVGIVACGQNVNADAAWTGIRSNLAKRANSCVLDWI